IANTFGVTDFIFHQRYQQNVRVVSFYDGKYELHGLSSRLSSGITVTLAERMANSCPGPARLQSASPGAPYSRFPHSPQNLAVSSFKVPHSRQRTLTATCRAGASLGRFSASTSDSASSTRPPVIRAQGSRSSLAFLGLRTS